MHRVSVCVLHSKSVYVLASGGCVLLLRYIMSTHKSHASGHSLLVARVDLSLAVDVIYVSNI